MPTVVANYKVEDDSTDSIMILHVAGMPKGTEGILGATGEVHERANDGHHGPRYFDVVAAPNGNLYARWRNGDAPERLRIEVPLKVGGVIARIAGFGRYARELIYIIQEVTSDD